MKTKILAVLRKEKDFVSGQKLCETLDVSRTAVWKHIKKLKEDGYEIESVNNKGYRLLKEPDVMDYDSIYSHLETDWLGRELMYFDEIDSTNTKAKILAEDGGQDGLVVVSDCQLKGKGRRGRTWESPRGENVYFSILLRPEILAENASMLTIIAAMAVTRGIKEVTGIDAMIKWPNDVVSGGHKLCGILTESSTDLEYVNYLVVGIGINCNQESFPKEISEVASSLLIESGRKVDRSRLIAAVLKAFEEYYEKFLVKENLSDLKDEYNSMLVNVGKDVKLIYEGNEVVRKAIGINDKGALVTEDEAGQRYEVISGEVSVRGLYGYV